jgi:hypothetical protein
MERERSRFGRILLGGSADLAPHSDDVPRERTQSAEAIVSRSNT